MFNFSSLHESQLKQYINSVQAFDAYQKLLVKYNQTKGSVYWRSSNGFEYLTQRLNGKIINLGIRNEKTELIHSQFNLAKTKNQTNLSTILESINRNERVNKALKVGNAPNIVIDILNRLEKAGIGNHFLVIGTNALYAYEMLAGVRINSDITATEDIDLLWDSRKRFTLLTDSDEDFKKDGLIGLIKQVDKSFDIIEDSKYRAINSSGYMIDIVKRRPLSYFNDNEPTRLTNKEDDFHAAKIFEMNWLLSVPRINQTVISFNGRMANMPTIDPRAYLLYKFYLSEKENRNPVKKPRDKLQAIALFDLIQNELPHLDIQSIHALPLKLRTNEVIEKLSLLSGNHFSSADNRTEDILLPYR